MAKIVVVEDERDLAEIIVEELSDFGHEVHTARNGVEGIEAIRKHRPQIVLADINMPQMNGFQMRQKLVETEPELAKRPFVFVSAFAEKSDIADGLILGADHYVTKPIDFDALHAWVRTLTR